MNPELKQKLIDRVIEEIKNDFNNSDETAIDGLLWNCPEDALVQFLPEEEWNDFKEVKDNRTSIVKELESKITQAQEDIWIDMFEKRAQHMGNGVYRLGRLHSTDTRELFLMFIADMEDIDYAGKTEEPEDEVA